MPDLTIPQSAPLSDIDQIKQKISELQRMLQVASPQYESHLFTIHKALAADEALVHLLSEEDIGTIVGALSKKKNVKIVEGLVDGRKQPGLIKRLKGLTAEEL